jgi:iron complex transport system substrate-binding protein
MRVVSLLPSATEMLSAIGASDLLVGRSHECDFPAGITGLPVLTRAAVQGEAAQSSQAVDAAVRELVAAGSPLYELDERLLAELRPDVVLTQDLCAVCSIDLRSVHRTVAAMRPAPRVLSFNPTRFMQVLDDMLALGDAVGRAAPALEAVTALRDRWWTAAEQATPYVDGPSVLFLEWTDPPFVGGHWTPELIEAAGARHPLNAPGAHSRVPTAEEIVASAPERVVICPCGYDLERTRQAAREAARQPWWHALPAVSAGEPGRVVLVDGNQMFNRPGPRLVCALEWLVSWLCERPELAPKGFPAEPFEG